jgi:ribosomal protein S18 acetylase RimI-like enzyme
MAIALRPAVAADYAFCRQLYFRLNSWLLEALQLNRAAHEAKFPEQWNVGEVRIIALDGQDIGWLQWSPQANAFFLGQLYIDTPFQKHGIGTEVMRGLIAEAADAQKPIQLDVVKINPALRLYVRLGFLICGEEEHKFNMIFDPRPRQH